MRRAGKKTKAWNECRAQLKPKFLAAGITRCEINSTGCWRDNGLTFAHARKRLDLKDGELSEVILACIPCHDQLERLPKALMYNRVQKIIKNRTDQQKRLLT